MEIKQPNQTETRQKPNYERILKNAIKGLKNKLWKERGGNQRESDKQNS